MSRSTSQENQLDEAFTADNMSNGVAGDMLDCHKSGKKVINDWYVLILRKQYFYLR